MRAKQTGRATAAQPLCQPPPPTGRQGKEEKARGGLGQRSKTGQEGMWALEEREDKAGLRGRTRVWSSKRRTKAWAQYLEGGLRDETVKVTHGGGDIHRYSPLFLSCRLGRLQQGHG